VGALLAIPAAATIQIALHEWWEWRQGPAPATEGEAEAEAEAEAAPGG
jgi:hypothetical protein